MNHHSPFEPIYDAPEPLVKKPFYPEPEPPGKKPFRGWRLLGIVVVAVFAAWTFDQIVDWENGKPKLKEWRKRQMEKEMEEIDNAEQYVLLAINNGYYPCLKCPKSVVFLHIGEVYRYGVTRKGLTGRYTETWLSANKLDYVVQFKGTLNDCLKEEKRKIFQYPLLPENYLRPPQNRLVKPPGNLRTD